MGKHFGNLQRLYGVAYYTISPHEVRPLVGILNPGIKNAFRRLFEQGTPFAIAAAVLYVTITETKKYHIKINRKDPELYKDDV